MTLYRPLKYEQRVTPFYHQELLLVVIVLFQMNLIILIVYFLGGFGALRGLYLKPRFFSRKLFEPIRWQSLLKI